MGDGGSLKGERTPRDAVVTREGPVLTLAFDRPATGNALTWAMYDTVTRALETAAGDPALRCVVLRGRGDGPFASGTDISQFAGFTDGEDGVEYERRISAVLDTVAGVPVPTVAFVRRHAVGAGLLLAAACDLRVCTEGTRFGVPVAHTLGNCLSQHAFDLLADRLGASRTVRMLVTGRLFDAAEALTSGFVAEVLPAESAETQVGALVDRITRLAPLTLRATKLADAARRTGRPSPVDFVHACYGSADFRDGVRGYLDHRSPAWAGR